jgi:hypothetical protein
MRGVRGTTIQDYWRCSAWHHDEDGKVQWRQFFTIDPETMPCPEHGRDFLVKDA